MSRRYLLDTCVAIWYFEGSPEIPKGLLGELRDFSNDVLLSDISVLEIVIKYGLGKLPLPSPPSRVILPLAAKHGFELLPLCTEAVFGLEDLPHLHRDPFDRLLISEARLHGLTLITPDPLIRQYDVNVCWPE